MENQHTPGPWKAIQKPHTNTNRNKNRYFHIECENGFYDDETNTGIGFAGCMNESDAKLIAASPEMLKALEEIFKTEGAYNKDPLLHAENVINSMVSIARKAIEKATK